MSPDEIKLVEQLFPDERDQSKAIWYIRSAKAAAVAVGKLPTKDRVWDQYCHSAMVWGVRDLLAPHKIEKFLPMLRKLELLGDDQR